MIVPTQIINANELMYKDEMRSEEMYMRDIFGIDEPIKMASQHGAMEAEWQVFGIYCP